MLLRGFWLGLIVAVALVGCFQAPSGPALPAMEGLHVPEAL